MSQMGRLFLERQMQQDECRRESLRHVSRLVADAQCQLRHYQFGTDSVGGRCLGISRKLTDIQVDLDRAIVLSTVLAAPSPQSGKFDAQIRCGGKGFWVNVAVDLVVVEPRGLGYDRELELICAMGGKVTPGYVRLGEWSGKFSKFQLDRCPDPATWLSNTNEILLADGREGAVRMTDMTIEDGRWTCQFTGIGELSQPTKENQDE